MSAAAAAGGTVEAEAVEDRADDGTGPRSDGALVVLAAAAAVASATRVAGDGAEKVPSKLIGLALAADQFAIS